MNPSRKAFTLIEMLIVITIIGILAALIMPGLFKARDKAKETQCKANLKNLGLIFATYTNRHEGKYPKLTTDGFSVFVDSHGNHLYPIEAIIRYGEGELTPTDGWLSGNKSVDNVAVCPTYPRQYLKKGSTDFNPCAYSYNRHVDGDGSVPVDDLLAERPSGGITTCAIRTEGNATNPTELCIMMDSADTGSQYQRFFNWACVPDNVDNEGSLPNRHSKGGNLLFASGNVEWKANSWLRDKANARQWLIPAADKSGAWTD